MINSIIITGIGGQGTILASKLLARAAMDAKLPVRTAETIGMAQRGGGVVSHVRIGGAESSMTPLGGADLIIGFEPCEAARALPYLRRGATVVTAKRAILPVTASLAGESYSGQDMIAYMEKYARVIAVDTDEICRAVGSPRVANVALLGAAAASGALGLSTDQIAQAISQSVKPQFVRMNLEALRIASNI